MPGLKNTLTIQESIPVGGVPPAFADRTSIALRCQYERGYDVNKFEQVFSDGYQMLLVGDGAGTWGKGPCAARSNVSWVSSHMGLPAMNTLTDGQTRMKT